MTKAVPASACDSTLEGLPDERDLKALYMLRPPMHAPIPSSSPSFELRALPSERRQTARALIELEQPVSAAKWQSLGDGVLPDGLFVARERGTALLAGTASAVHKPRGSRFYFPGGDAVGYLVVAPRCRGRGLGALLVDAVVRRFETAGYRHVWVAVQGWRLPAICTYLGAGFQPFLHSPEPQVLEARWRRIFARLNRYADAARWPEDFSIVPVSMVPV